jgi:DNA-binding transcriptional MerR regulator
MAKYYTIAEVSEILSISKANLRYLETTIKKFKIKKIRGRRYYTEDNIGQLKIKLEEKGLEIGQLELFKPTTTSAQKEQKPQSNLLSRIENLEKKFIDLQKRLKAA